MQAANAYSGRSLEFSEKAIRQEFHKFAIEVRQTHESVVDSLLKSARERAGVAVSESTSRKVWTTKDFVPRVKSSKNAIKFSVETYKKHPQPKKYISHNSVMLPFTPALPLYKDYTPLSNGIHVEDDEYLRYLPYFGENGEEDGLNLEEMFEDKTDTQADLLRREKAQFLSVNFLSLMSKYGIAIGQLVAYFLYHVGSNAQTRKQVLPDRFEIEEKKRKLLEEHTRKLDNRSIAKVELICRLFKETTQISVWDVLNVYPTTALIEDKRAALRSSQSAPVYALDSYASLLCSFCLTHECPWHDAPFLTVSREGLVKAASLQECDNSNRSNASSKILPDSIPCSADCFTTSTASSKVPMNWTEDELSLLKLTWSVMAKNDRTSCLLTTMLKKPCYVIHSKLEELELTPKHAKRERSSLLRANGLDSLNGLNKRKRKAQFVYPDDCSLSGNHLKRGNVSPCMHAGPCDATSCACVHSSVFCEKPCACAASCPRRWRGCRCTTGKCRTSACDCFKWNRECDPDLCRSCGADEVLDPKNRDMAECKRYCKNVNLQRGLGKRVIVGPSNVAGWGLFMGEQIKQDEYLGEYKGELISQDEAERRGKIYDKRGVSFLFESTKDQCVDATRAGNKLRFINHSRHNPNCHARILLVNGIHKIAFFARRRIKEGEELFIDYGYNNKTMKFVPFEVGKRSDSRFRAPEMHHRD